MKKLWVNIFYNTFISQQTESEKLIQEQKKRVFNKKLLVITVIACISLSCIEYIGKNDGYYTIIRWIGYWGWDDLADQLRYYIQHKTNSQLFSLAYWVFIIFFFYVILPAGVIKLVFREKLSDYGLGLGSVINDYKVYLLFFIIMFPLVLFFSGTESFQLRYPFYRLQSGEPLYPAFFSWQLLYFFQFIGVEFFFRGFLVHGLKRQFGYYSVFVMTIPYCMIHFGKPFPETIAAIIAGIVLGTLSLKSRSVWMGVFIHYTVALTMDLSALWQKGLL